MNPEHAALLQRLNAFNFDAPDATFPFSSRLAKENQWSPSYARRVIAEYKRFTFLAVAAGHPVSPSEEVDQAWHLHLTYSQNYWRVFCPEVLQKPFHHSPTKGGANEHAKFGDWYAQTLASYEHFFGEPPPADIWPSLESRLQTRQHFVRVDRATHWVIRKPSWRISPALAGAVGLIGITFCGTGAMFANGANPLDWRGPAFLAFFIFLSVICFGLALWLRRQLCGPLADEVPPDSNLSAYDLAYLNGGKVLTVNTGIANLVRQNILVVDAGEKRLLPGNENPGELNELELAIYRAAARSNGEKLSEVRVAAKTVVREISERLKSLGLVVNNAQAIMAIWLPLLIMFVPLALGGIKIYLGIMRGKPVVFLVVLSFIGLIASLAAFARRPIRSRRGNAVLGQLQAQHETLKNSLGNAAIDPLMFTTSIGLFGLAALDNTPWNSLKKDLAPPGGSSSGCGGSCGGSCGGGCGGCGGGD